MSYYKCTFMNEAGELATRTLFADSKQAVRANYEDADEKLISIQRLFFSQFSLFKIFSRKVKYSEFLLFNQKLIVMLKAGITFIRALEVIVSNMKKGHLREILSQAKADIQNGIQISDAFASSQLPFLKIYRSSLLAGEKSGDLVSVIEKFNGYLEKITNLRRKTVSSLSYPVILFFFMIGIVTVVMVYVIPKFSSFYESFEAQLPFFTQFFISTSVFLKGNFLLFIAIFLAVFASIKLLEKANDKIIIMDRLKLKIPLIGKIITENAMAVFSRTMNILISGGIPVPESTAIAVETFSNKYLFSKIRHIAEKIKEGNLLSQVLDEVDEVPKIMVEVVRVGDSSGNLPDVLNKNADFFETSIDTKINTIISLIEPVIIIVLGLVILFMLLSIYLPIFNTIRVVR
jgi:type IV pilus assembly protein PilC